MYKRKLVVVMLLKASALCGCASTDPWTREDTQWQLAYMTAIAADAYTTATIQHHDHIEEVGTIARPVLGAQPQTGETLVYFAAVAVAHYFIARRLPKKWRRWWQVGNAGYHGYLAIGNCTKFAC